MFCGVILGVLSSLAIMLLGKRKLIALICVLAICVLSLPQCAVICSLLFKRWHFLVIFTSFCRVPKFSVCFAKTGKITHNNS